MMTLSYYQVEKIVAEMVKATKEIEKARDCKDYNGDDEYIGYREGLYDAYFDILCTLGYTLEEIEEMEARYQN